MPGYREVIERLAALHAGADEISIVHGNRDFHLGDDFIQGHGGGVENPRALFRLRHHCPRHQRSGVEDGTGAADQVQPPNRDKIRGAWARADEMDGHDAMSFARFAA